jgi:hypothetical protein
MYKVLNFIDEEVVCFKTKKQVNDYIKKEIKWWQPYATYSNKDFLITKIKQHEKNRYKTQ